MPAKSIQIKHSVSGWLPINMFPFKLIVYTASAHLRHLLGNNVDHVRRRDVLLALWAWIMFLPSSAALFFPLLFLLLLLLCFLFLPTLLLQFHILVRHGQTCGTEESNAYYALFLIIKQMKCTRTNKNLNRWQYFNCIRAGFLVRWQKIKPFWFQHNF